MGFGAAIASCFNNYAGFSGRAPRSEYWWWFLFVMLIGLGAGFVSGFMDIALGTKMPGFILRGAVDLLLLLPNLAVGIRRLHDLDRSGWWYGASAIIGLFLLALAIPVFLRMHENRLDGYGPMDGIPSGVFLVIVVLGLAEIIYGLMLFIWFCMAGTHGGNRFGADPLRRGILTIN
jgi:uncharacterized membrane protein YhaH (DUF805 family)